MIKTYRPTEADILRERSCLNRNNHKVVEMSSNSMTRQGVNRSLDALEADAKAGVQNLDIASCT